MFYVGTQKQNEMTSKSQSRLKGRPSSTPPPQILMLLTKVAEVPGWESISEANTSHKSIMSNIKLHLKQKSNELQNFATAFFFLF